MRRENRSDLMVRKTFVKKILLLVFCFLTIAVNAFPQAAETFDIASFQPPKGWKKQASQNSIQFSTSDEAKGAYCLITLFRSVPGIGNSKENFAAAWQTIVKEAVNVTASPADAAFEQYGGLEGRMWIGTV